MRAASRDDSTSNVRDPSRPHLKPRESSSVAAWRDCAMSETERLQRVHDELTRLMSYLQSPKFQGPDADYVHIRTDLWDRLQHIRRVANDT